jgi:starch phosphorylase
MCGKDRWLGTSESLECDMCQVSDEQLWQFRIDATHGLVDYARERLSRQLAASGFPLEEVESAKHLFDPNTLTLSFARRFATYKRPNLLLHDPARLLRLLTDPERPVQLIIAGKAHPADDAGQALIRQWIEFIREPAARQHVIFLSDYDMRVTEQLVQGSDVWVNTPRRPWEASGTSGMKVLVNGGINLSELDGWWAEAYSPEVGWAIGDGQEHGDDPAWDAIEANQLYDVLETEVIPEFYNRNQDGIPTQWLARMRASMSMLTPQYSAVRSVREYTEQYYLPAAKSYRKRADFNGAMGTSIFNWQHSLREKWNSLKFGKVNSQSNESEHRFEVEVNLDGLEPSSVRVEIYADGVDGDAATRQEMALLETSNSGDQNWEIYHVSMPATRPVSDYTPRIIPKHPGIAVPLELDLIQWQR